ncbi:MAG: GPW/gp25 family protein [Gemmatimonadaceae bacterium]|nr:GPW/gp25 family protein [Chitinophagaceae bacterium]
MQKEFYSLPLAVEKLMREPGDQSHHTRHRELAKCSLQQSVEQNLHLLLTTAFGEFPADELFGCSIWENDFDNLTSAPKMKESIRQSILQSVQQHENRLGKVRVELMIQQEELPDAKGRRVKKRIEITISGMLQLTNEKFIHRDSFFVGPLSY